MPPTPSKTRLYLFRLALVILSPLLFLGVLELGLRLCTTGHLYLFEQNPHFLDTDGWVRLRPGLKTWWYGCHYEINAQGFRMSRDVGPKTGVRILGIGDSVTLGMGVRRTEEVWPSKLGTLIRERGLPNIETINSGVEAWNLLLDRRGKMQPAQYTAFVKAEGPKLQPDLVVYCICLNDIPSRLTEVFDIDNKANRQRFQLFPEASREWFKRKAIYRLLRDGYRESRFQRLDFSAIPTPPPDASFWVQVREEVQNLKSAVEGVGAELFCVVVPFSYQLLPANRDLNRVNEKWHETLAACGVPFVDLTASFDEQTVLSYFALGDYVHLNAKGHDLIARKALEMIGPALAKKTGGKVAP